MKKKLSFCQIICIIIAAIIPFIENSIRWTVYVLLPQAENLSTQHMSMENIMNTQIGGFASVIFWGFYIVLALTAIFCILEISDFFKREDIIGIIGNHKAMVLLPLASTLLYVVIMLTCDNHSAQWTYLYQTRYAATGLEPLVYIALIPLAALCIIEVYKQVKLKDEE